MFDRNLKTFEAFVELCSTPLHYDSFNHVEKAYIEKHPAAICDMIALNSSLISDQELLLYTTELPSKGIAQHKIRLSRVSYSVAYAIKRAIFALYNIDNNEVHHRILEDFEKGENVSWLWDFRNSRPELLCINSLIHKSSHKLTENQKRELFAQNQQLGNFIKRNLTGADIEIISRGLSSGDAQLDRFDLDEAYNILRLIHKAWKIPTYTDNLQELIDETIEDMHARKVHNITNSKGKK